VVSMPSFSKDSFGLVEFQRVALDPNRKMDSPIFALRTGLKKPSGPPDQVGRL
jgi:hypothetical protein